MIFMAERCRFPASGIAGGGDGATGEVLIDGQAVDHRRNLVLNDGQHIVLRTPGGGGFGSAPERDHDALRHDCEEGYAGDETFD
jgi:N-methylhydantoinase B